MAKDKLVELKYKIEGLKRMSKRKTLRGRKNRIKSLQKQRLIYHDYNNPYY